MQRIGDRLIYSASDLNDYLECAHLTALNRGAALDEVPRPEADDADDRRRALLSKKGDEHERAYLARLHATGARVIELATRVRADETFEEAQSRTLAAIETGAPYIYQPTFYDGTFLGRADFLRRVDRPCAARDWSYEVIDTKLARSTRAYYLLQLCAYSLHLANLQGGTIPENMYVALGSGEERSFRSADYLAYYRRLRTGFLARAASIGSGLATYPHECSHCAICAWASVCERRRRSDDHLCIVAGMRRDQADKLALAGIPTLAALARAALADRPVGLNPDTFENLALQASLQFAAREARAANGPRNERFRHHLLPRDPKGGLSTLPQPDGGDVYFDMEGDPFYAPEGGLEYLFGVYLPDEDRYIPFWARSAAEERRALTEFIDFVLERRKRYPNLRVYHYANYEKAALGRLTMRYATRRDELDDLLRGQVFVDLYTVVRQSVRISQESYSIKKLEPFYDFERKAALKRGDDSILLFEEWLDSGDDSILSDIQEYNDEDCRSTYFLHRWLLERRDELAARDGIDIPWPTPEEQPELNAEQVETHAAMLDVREAILAGLDAPADALAVASFSDASRLRWFLGNAVDYHWNESKPEWWRFHYRCENVDELVEFDHDSIGGLRWCEDVAPYKLFDKDKNLVYTFEYPEQQHHLKDKTPVDPDTGKGAGAIVGIDERARRVALKRSPKLDHGALRALIPGRPQDTRAMQNALLDLGRSFLEATLVRDHPAVVDILLGAAPRLRDRPRGAIIQPPVVTGESLAQTIAALDGSYLVVQGPPGSGKSTMGGEAIAKLLGRGMRIGILARSHKAAHNLIAAVERAARATGVMFLGAHKGKDEKAYESPAGETFVTSTDDGAEALAPAHQLVSGTPWLFSRPEAAGQFDVLFVDEAGQLALADAIACARAAHNVVLLGDPLQLAQISQGSHPPGIGRSVLQHLLGDRTTIPPDRGIFLPRSWRMHPAICEFISETVYQGRLGAAGGNELNRVESPGLSGSGLRWIPVEHSNHRRECAPEADAIVEAIRALRAGTRTLRTSPAEPIGDDDILVVSPYNAQRALIKARLESAGFGAIRVGTVDKFQGLEAPVVFYSMATSSGDDLPRDLEFLFEKNRFNVAISRAQCMSVLVCSPRLLEIRCRTAEQMALINLLCAFVESAEAQAPALVGQSA
jgi:predicted RecB family nuclease